MSTFMANKKTVERKWYILDAANKPLGRTAAQAAVLIRGKHKADFTPHVDCGDFVIIVNADKEKPELAMYLAVKGMMPKNTLGKSALVRLKVYSGENHGHDAQKPVAFEQA